MTLSRWTILWVLVVVILLTILVLEVAGVLRIEDLIANPVLLLIGFSIVGILAAVGAMFIGIFVSYRIFAGERFSPFEREMLDMREEVQAIRERLEELVRATDSSREKD